MKRHLFVACLSVLGWSLAPGCQEDQGAPQSGSQAPPATSPGTPEVPRPPSVPPASPAAEPITPPPPASVPTTPPTPPLSPAPGGSSGQEPSGQGGASGSPTSSGGAADLWALARSEINKTPSFVPTIHTDGVYPTGRYVPHVYASSPFGQNETIELEVPEYVWAEVEGDKNNDSPFYYGRSLKSGLGWVMRYPTLEKPKWQKSGTSLELVSPLKGGFTVTFKVVPRDRMFEIHCGIKNDSGKRITNVRHVPCAGTNKAKTLFCPHPKYSRLYQGGQTVGWDAAGQDLKWLDSHDNPDGSFSKVIQFRAYLRGHEPANFATMPKLQDNKYFFFQELIDLPAIAKGDELGKKFLVVYTPYGREAFTNIVTPCLHGNAYLDEIPSGQTGWLINYHVFFEGDIAAFYDKLAALHPALVQSALSGRLAAQGPETAAPAQP